MIPRWMSATATTRTLGSGKPMTRPGPTPPDCGKVVLADDSYSDRPGRRFDPASSCEASAVVRLRAHLPPVASRIHGGERSATLVVVRSQAAESRTAGLLTDSVIVCDRVATIGQPFVRRPVGLVFGDRLDRVATAPRITLGLSWQSRSDSVP